MADVKVTKDLENKTLLIECEVNAPKEKVWRAYADKEMFEKWWGPEGWETTTKEFDFKPGGRVHYDMKCVDENQGEWFGQSSWGLMVIESIDEPNNFVYNDYFSDEDGNIDKEKPAIITTIELSEAGGKTKLVTRASAKTAEQIEELLKMGIVEGFSSQLKKLDQLLAE